MVARGGDTSAGEAWVLRGEGDVPRTGGAGPPVVSPVADVGAPVGERPGVEPSTGARLLCVVTTAPGEVRGGARVSGLVGRNGAPAVVCPAVGPATGVAVLVEGSGVGAGEGGVLGAVAVHAVGVRAALVLVAGRVGSVDDSVKGGAPGILEAELPAAAPAASVGRDSQRGGLDAAATCPWCGWL